MSFGTYSLIQFVGFFGCFFLPILHFNFSEVSNNGFGFSFVSFFFFFWYWDLGGDCLCIIGFLVKSIANFLSLHTRILGVFLIKKSNAGVTHIALMSNYDQFHTYFLLKWLKLEVTKVDQHPCTGHAGSMP